MGRPNQQSNVEETNGIWVPVGDDATGWIYTTQTYDWKGRPLRTTNQDGTYKDASYGGCGCAGGEVVTLTDEVSRRQRVSSDSLGRQWKTEVLNWDGSVYSTTTNTFNARDQVTLVRQWAGAENGGGAYQDTTMTFDGYGRLQSKHVPEQNAGTSTTYSYNNDDTIYSVTDARGATCTYGYNGRHQVTSATHALSGQATIVLSYGYDAAGNRTSMMDSQGSTSYAYDSLSRMTSEARSFSSFGSYTLNYQYNLGGELTSVTDPFNAQVGYNHDNTGRVTSVTGSGFGNVSTYASNLQYRAWGALKHLTYGNTRALDLSFNGRLQTTHFQVSAPSAYPTQPNPISLDYQYYSDGRISFAHDVVDQTFDRSYAYDNAARISQALSGAEARGEPATNNRPYNQTFGFDAFGNMLSRIGKHWSRNASNYLGTFVNNRMQSASYDADGRLLQQGSITNTYDAAGDLTLAVDTTQRRAGMTSFSTTQTYDGDGRMIRQVQNGQTTYYLLSTVLDGLALTELNAQGQKQFGNVFVNGQLLAKQNVYLNVPVYQHPEPHNIEQGESLTYPDGTIAVGETQLGPLGDDVGTEDPYVDSSGGGPVNLGWPLYGDPADMGRGCTRNGIPVDCFFMLYIMGKGINVTDYGWSIGETTLYESSMRWVPGRKIPGKQNNTIEPLLDAKGHQVYTDDGEPVYVLRTTDAETKGHWESTEGPQNSGFDLDAIKRLVTGALSNHDCAEFMSRVLNAASSKKNPVLHGGNASTIYNDFLNQKNGGLTRERPPGSLGYGSPTGRIAKGNAKIYLIGGVANQTVVDAIGVIDELAHLAGSKGSYTDELLANIVHDIPEYAALSSMKGPHANVFDPNYERKDEAAKNPNAGGWSSYFHDIQRKKCHVGN